MTPWGAALALIFAGGAALAQEAADLAPESAPVPEARPDDGEAIPEPAPEGVPQLIPPEELQAAEPTAEDPSPIAPEGTGAAEEVAKEVGPDAEMAEETSLTLPGEAGADASVAAPEEATGPRLSFPSNQPEEEPQEPAGPPMHEVLAEIEAELAACLAKLDQLGATYERADPILDPDIPDCGIANPLTVSQVAPGVALEPPTTLRCAAALAAARWVADVALPLSAKLEGRGALVVIDQGTSYLCRPRADGELSEHAFGNALDVMGFRFASGEPIPVQPRAGDGTLEEAFQRAVRAGACLDFTTVLGPGSDADHADHLHLDVRERDNGFRICE